MRQSERERARQDQKKESRGDDVKYQKLSGGAEKIKEITLPKA